MGSLIASRHKSAIKRLSAAALLALLPIQFFAEQPASDPLAFVDPMIGTGPEGRTFPGAIAPFGMVQLSPDTDATCQIRECYDHAAGYSYNDPTIQGVSHTHFSGAGHSDLGDILVMPQVREVKLDPGDPKQPGSGYRQRFSHDTEKASPGYYAVTLADSGIRRTSREREETLALRREVAEAIATRDPARARAAMESHFANSIGEMLRDQF